MSAENVIVTISINDFSNKVRDNKIITAAFDKIALEWPIKSETTWNMLFHNQIKNVFTFSSRFFWSVLYKIGNCSAFSLDTSSSKT